MKKILLSVSTTILFLTGCNLKAPAPGPKPQQLPTIDKPVAPVKDPKPAVQSFSVARTSNVKMRLKFIYPQTETAFCQKLADRLAGNVLLENAEIVFDDNYDGTISITPDFEEKDSTAPYNRVICREVKVAVQIANTLKLLTVIEPAPRPRAMGLDNAKFQYLKETNEKVCAFLEKRFAPMANQQLGFTEIAFMISTDKGSNQSVAHIEKLAQVLKTTKGIVRFFNVAQDVSKGECTFRIVYIKNAFPEGVSNHLSAKLATIK